MTAEIIYRRPIDSDPDYLEGELNDLEHRPCIS